MTFPIRKMKSSYMPIFMFIDVSVIEFLSSIGEEEEESEAEEHGKSD